MAAHEPAPAAPDPGDAVLTLLAHRPGTNDEEFARRFPSRATRQAVQDLVDEAIRIPRSPLPSSLIDIGVEVRTCRACTHPELSDAALRKLANVVTYLLR